MSRDAARLPVSPRVSSTAADVRVRNYDLGREHHLAIRVYDEDGHVAFEAGFDLDPGGSAAHRDVLDGGTYLVEADCDAEKYLVATCELAGGPADLQVSVGNGVLDVGRRAG